MTVETTMRLSVTEGQRLGRAEARWLADARRRLCDPAAHEATAKDRRDDD